MELEKLLDCISFYRLTWKVAEDTRKAETAALLDGNTVSAERIADTLQNELGKSGKEETHPKKTGKLEKRTKESKEAGTASRKDDETEKY